jgi:hypothetical protein
VDRSCSSASTIMRAVIMMSKLSGFLAIPDVLEESVNIGNLRQHGRAELRRSFDIRFKPPSTTVPLSGIRTSACTDNCVIRGVGCTA